MNYNVIDTRITTNETRTNSVRVSATVGDDDRNALLYTTRNLRLTLFEPAAETARAFNETIASLSGDRVMCEELDEFTNKYCQ